MTSINKPSKRTLARKQQKLENLRGKDQGKMHNPESTYFFFSPMIPGSVATCWGQTKTLRRFGLPHEEKNQETKKPENKNQRRKESEED